MVFPLFAVIEGKCACGRPECPRVGKHPAVEWGELARGSEVPRPAAGAGAGIKTGAAPKGSGLFVVDLDGEGALDAWLELGGSDDTFTVETPRANGGLHLYFKHPGFHVGNSAGSLARGIDVRGDGGFVVAPGSPHRSGGTYATVDDRDPAPAPAWLLAWLEARSTVETIQPHEDDVEGDALEHNLGLFIHACRTMPPSVEGAGGDLALWRVVQRGAYDLALPGDVVLEAVREWFDPRCSPPWGDALDERVAHKVQSAKTQSTKPRVEPMPPDLAHLVTGAPTSSADTLASFKAAAVPAPSSWRETVDELEAPPMSTRAPVVAQPTSRGELLPITWGRWNEITPPTVYLLEGLIPESKVCTFFAEGGSVKTWAAFALGIAVATGEPWLGEYPVQKGRVLFLDFEDGRHEFQRRRALLMGPLADDVPDLGYLYAQASLLEEATWRYLAGLGLKLLIIDSISAATPSDLDENSREFVEMLRLAGLFTEASNCTVVFVHHANKTGGMRGYSGIRDQCDVVFKFEAVSETDDVKRMRMVCDKPGPQKKPLPVNIELSDKGLGTFKDEAHEKGRNATTPEGVRDAMLKALIGGPIATKELVRDAVKKGSADVYPQLAALIATGDVVKIPGEGYQLDNENKRLSRVLARLRSGGRYKTLARLAEAAHVDVDFVRALEAQGAIAGSGEGRILEVQK